LGLNLTTTSTFNSGNLRFRFIDPEFGYTQAERVLQIFKSISCEAWIGMAFGCNDFFHLEQNLESLAKPNIS